MNLYPTAQQGLLNWLVEKCTKGENDLTITTQQVEAYAHVRFQPIIPAPTTTIQNLSARINLETRNLVDFYASNELRF